MSTIRVGNLVKELRTPKRHSGLLGSLCTLLARAYTVGLLLALAPAGSAAAHGFGERYTLPVPLWLYLYGAAAAVVLSFVLVGFLVGEEHVPERYRRFNLFGVPWLRALLTSPLLLGAVRVVSVALFALVILAGLIGEQVPSLNFAPTFVWVIWWVGFSILVALLGNVWPLVNPWKILFEWADAGAHRLGLRGGIELFHPYPERLGVWPALALFVAFAWIELIYDDSARPLSLAFLALAYSVITWTGMVFFGKHEWLRRGEAFSVYFGILGRFAPTEVRVADPAVCAECGAACRVGSSDCVDCYECWEDAPPEARELNLRPWAVGLTRTEGITADRLVFVVFMLSVVTIDGLLETPLWLQVETLLLPLAETLLGTLGYSALRSLALLVIPLCFLAAYYGFALLMRAFGGSRARLGEVAAVFVYSLVPIALAYQIAHYYTLLLVQGQGIIALLSDPFGWGWNLLGTAGYRVNAGLIGAAFAWYSQVALIVAGHVVAVYLAHVIALRWLRNPKRALRSQYPMLALMVLYTVSSLWIISQPLVEENRAAAHAPSTSRVLAEFAVRPMCGRTAVRVSSTSVDVQISYGIRLEGGVCFYPDIAEERRVF